MTSTFETDWEQLLAVLANNRRLRINRENIFNIEKRVDNWLKPAYAAFVASQPPSACSPPLLDVSYIPEVVSVLCSAPLNKPLPKELTEAVIDRLPLYALEWKKERDQELLGIIRQASRYANQDVSVDVLRLASTIFVCEACHDSISYPSVISHPCNLVSKYTVKARTPGVKPPSVTRKQSSRTKPLMRIFEVENDLARHIGPAVCRGVYRSSIWGGFHRISFDEPRHEHMVNMLDALQWSPMTLVSEMEEKDPCVDCLCQCFFRMRGSWSGGKISLKWNEAVRLK